MIGEKRDDRIAIAVHAHLERIVEVLLQPGFEVPGDLGVDLRRSTRVT